MIIRYNKETNVTIEPQNAIGATTSTTLRTVTAHSNVNSVYVAANGSPYPYGDGTDTNPFDTFDDAITYLAGKTIITVIRNGYGGDIILNPPTIEIPANMTIQTELGEIATILGTTPIYYNETNDLTEIIAVGYDPLSNRFQGYREFDGLFYYSNDGREWIVTETTQSQGLASEFISYNGITTLVGWIDGESKWRIISVDGGINWLNANIEGYALAKRFDFLAVYNGLWIGSTDGLATRYSVDGYNFDYHPALPDNTKSIGVDENGNWLAYIWIDNANGEIWKSADGYSWTISAVITVVSNYFDRLTWGNDLWVAHSNGDDKIYCSRDGVVWTESDQTGKVNIKFINNWFFIFGTDMLMTRDMITFYTVESESTFVDMAWDGRKIYHIANHIPFYGNGIAQYTYLSMIDFLNSGCIFNGFIFDCNDVVTFGVVDAENNTTTLKWCTFANQIIAPANLYIGLINNVLVDESFLGIICRSELSAVETIISRIETEAIFTRRHNVTLSHVTIYDCETGIKCITDTLIAGNNDVVEITDTIVDKAIYVLSIENPNLSTYATYSILNGSMPVVIIPTPPYVAANCYRNVRVLYHDAANQDYHLRNKYEGYPLDSIGVLAASDGKDIGAWDILFTVVSYDWQTSDFHGQRYRIDRNEEPVMPEQGYTYSRSFKRSLLGYNKNWKIGTRDISTTQAYHHARAIAGYDDPLQVFPVGYLKTTVSAKPFVWLGVTADSIVRCEPGLAICNAITALAADDRPEGWFLVIKNIAGAIAPYTKYPMKIIEFAENRYLYLENYLGLYPGYGTGFDDPADGNYGFDIVRSLLVTIAEYNEVTDGIYRFSMVNTPTVTNQWAGSWLHINYATAIGSRKYFRIVSNNNAGDLYCDDPLGNVGSLTLGNEYVISIDLYMCKSVPDAFNPTPKQIEGSEYGKHGNDYFSTAVTREENTTWAKKGYLAYNDQGWELNIKETRDVDGDGL